MPAKSNKPSRWVIAKEIKNLDSILDNLNVEIERIHNGKKMTKNIQENMLVQLNDVAGLGHQITSKAKRLQFMLNDGTRKSQPERKPEPADMQNDANLPCFINNLRRELSRVKRHQYELIIYSVKVINLEELQDNFSKLALNAVTEKISNLLYETSRDSDILWQNTEAGKFLVALTDTQVENSDEICNRIRDKITAASFEYDGNEMDVKVAINFLTQKSENDGDPKELLDILG